MAITTLDGLIAGTRPPVPIMKITGTPEATSVLHSLLYSAGTPGAGVAPSPGLAGAALTSYGGQIPFVNPSGGAKTYLSRLALAGTQTGLLLLYDRLWHNSGLVVTTLTAQTINSVAWPARDRNGTVNGNDIQVGIEVSTATTNASSITNTTMSYTNQDGVSGRTATIASFPATAVAGTFIPFQLQAGDTGVRSIQSVTLGTSYGAGAIHLVAYRVIVALGLMVNNVGAELNPVTGGFPELFDNTVPCMLWLPSNTSSCTMSGLMNYAQG